jgi:hypothetical protein
MREFYGGFDGNYTPGRGCSVSNARDVRPISSHVDLWEAAIGKREPGAIVFPITQIRARTVRLLSRRIPLARQLMVSSLE